jgi:myo-inositol-1-phosphate synthase
VRCCKLALNHKLSGSLVGPSSYFMKSPPRQFTDEEARELTEKFITKHARTSPKRKAGAKRTPSRGKKRTR